MSSAHFRCVVAVTAPGSNPAELARLAHNLRITLLDHAEDVRAAEGAVTPDGAKSGTAVALGALAVTIAPIAAQAVFDIIQSWLSRQPTDIDVEIDGKRLRATGITREQSRAIVEAYLQQLQTEGRSSTDDLSR